MFVLLLSNINPQESDPTLFTSESSDVLLEIHVHSENDLLQSKRREITNGS